MSNDGTATPEPGRQQPDTPGGGQPAAPAPSGYEASSASGPAPSGYEATPSWPSAPSGQDAPTAAYPTSGTSSDAPTAAYPTAAGGDAPTAAYPTTPTSAWPTAPGSGPAASGNAGEGAPSPYAAPAAGQQAAGGAEQAGAGYPQPGGYPQGGAYGETGSGYPAPGGGSPQQGGAYGQPGYPAAGGGYPAAGGYPGPGGGGYPQQGGGYPAGAQPYAPNPYPGPGPADRTDGVSIAALVTGLLGTGVVAIILGVLGLRRTKRDGTKGRGLAIAGLVLGGLGVLGWIVTAVVVTTAIGAYDNRLDDLHAACDSGSMQACDDLYAEAPPGSDHEEFGATCGGRTDGVDYCVGLDLSEGSGDVEDGTDTGTAGAQAYGDDPALDAQWDACAAGDMAACDSLYLDSPAGSEYESFGETCGGTTDGAFLCDSATESGASTTSGAAAYGDDPELDALWDACEAGDGAACSELFWSSDADTAYEDFGYTCGNRVAEGSADCAAAIGG